MKFKKFTNFIFLVVSWLLSIVLLLLFLYLDNSNFSVISYYLLSGSISMIIYVISSLIHKHIVKGWKCSIATIKKCEYSFLSNCDLTYSFVCDGTEKNVIYRYSKLEKVGMQENIYISRNNKKMYRERDISFFSNNMLYVFLFVALAFICGALFINNLETLENFMWADYTVGEIFGYLFVIKFANLFLLLEIVIISIIVKKNKVECMAVEGTVIALDIRTHSDMDQISDIPVTRNYNMGTPKYEYYWNGETRIYVSNSSSTNIPKIGSTKKLFVDKDGIVVREKGEIGFLIMFSIIWMVFYLIMVCSVLFEIT